MSLKKLNAKEKIVTILTLIIILVLLSIIINVQNKQSNIIKSNINIEKENERINQTEILEVVSKENYTYTELEGEGTEENPYLIKTADHLREINNLLSSYYQLANDIDMTDIAFEPIGTISAPFKGTFDGNGHKINNLKIESNNQYVGMFGYIDRATIKNLGIENINVNATNSLTISYTGGLVGSNYYGTITNSYVTGKINSTNNGKIFYVSGLVAENNGGIITNSYVIGKVEGYNNKNTTSYYNIYIAGLVGTNNGTIENSYSIADIIGISKGTATTHVGGLVANNRKTITNSYWSIDTNIEGKIISNEGEGKTIHELLQQATYKNWDFETIWEMREGNILPYLKGMARPNVVEITNLEGKGTEENPYLIKTPEQLQKISYVQSAYYQFSNDIDASKITDFKLNKGNFKGVLDGRNYSINNLTIKSDSGYIGLFEQNSGTIKNLKLNNVNIESNYSGDTSYVGGIAAYNNGIIKNVEVNGRIKNIGNVTDLYLGQITGYNIGTINKIHINGILENEGTTINGYIGGIVGYNDGTLRISYNTGDIFVQNVRNLKIGGIAGKSTYISNVYSNGNINVNVTSAIIGGIVGENTGIVRNTYSTDNIMNTSSTYDLGGIVGESTQIIISSYYNNSNIVEQKGKGILKTLDELKQQETFENWNFDTIWNIEEDINTPVFRDIFDNDENYLDSDEEYETDGFWEWHTRTTTDDKAYNGKHIVINPGKSIDFLGYGITSYKDYLYKYYSNAGEKTFMFKIDETKANYHTLDGAGFIFNASKKDNLLSGYVLLIRQNDICIYRLDNVNAETFETGSNATVQTYAGNPIASIEKTSSTIHNLIVKTSPTNVTVIDNEEEILNVPLDYSKHSGEDFGLIASYEQHDCSILSEIQFLNFVMEVKDYTVPVLKTDENGNKLAGAKFQVKDAEGEVITGGTTKSNGIYNIKGLQQGIYTVEEIEAPAKHTFKNSSITFEFTNDGKIINPDTKEEIEIKFVNEKLKFVVKVVDTKGNPIVNSKVNLYDEEGKVVLSSDGQPIVVTTTADGTAIITDIEAGTYTFKQTQTPSDYILNDTIYTVEVSKDGTVTFAEEENGIIVNKKYGNVIIKKYEKGTTKGLEGAVIEIKDALGNSVKLTTNKNGMITFKAFNGIYTYKEITAPIGYKLNDTEYTFTSSDDGTVTYDSAKGIIYNDRVTMEEDLIITKKRTGTETLLPGAVIGIFDADGNKIAEKTTRENGAVSFTGLEVGSYYYKEISAPAGYILNNTEYHFTVNNDGSVTLGDGTTKVIYNDRVTMTEGITITKKRTGTE
ncbi:MAG: hypothetical protein HFJ41_02285, partial [Clostridia bacterium]|nr:hypothetical protein [Clostridia bacterium]